MVDLHKSGSSLGEMSKCLKVPRSSVQTIVRKYKHHGTMQPSYRSGRRRVLSPRDECTLVRLVQINPRTTAKKQVQKYLWPQSNTVKVLYRHNLKGYPRPCYQILMSVCELLTHWECEKINKS